MQVEFGESIKMVGNEACLGAWDLGKGVDLTWTDGDVWRGTVEIPVGAPLRFKARHRPGWCACMAK